MNVRPDALRARYWWRTATAARTACGWSPRRRAERIYLGRALAKMLVRPPVSKDASLTALDFEVEGLFHGRPWTPSIGVYDVKPRLISRNTLPGPLLGHLRTAAIIVAGYLTGARPEEICGWQHGAAPAPLERPKGSRLHLIRGRVWKGSRADDSGALGTEQEAAWATIPAATNAIHVAEQITKKADDEARWKRRLAQVAEYRADGNEWPRHAKTSDQTERTLGVWLHTQRIDYRAGKLAAAKEKQLNKVIPGWRQGRPRRGGQQKK
jgi:hypothetical protein